MEKIPAACAMEWSIQLEKLLRSRKPGKAIEAILEIGPRLDWWNSEPMLTMAEHKMFGLIPGEDKLFLNAILFRLVDAFRSGDKQTKISVVKVFLSIRKDNSKFEDDHEGILSKSMIMNDKELLRRVKFVFDCGDVEERALALGLFGCWVNFAKDSADVRYLIMSSLVSDHELEVKASLFAAGCFCEMLDDFASVFFEMLVNMLITCKTRSILLSGGRAFAKLWRPLSLADRAYKTGLKLALDASDEDFAVVMLISLSRIASKWTLLIPVQIDFIFSLLTKNTAPKLQLAAIRCLHILLERGVCRLPLGPEAIQKVLNSIDESESRPVLQREALKILHKILVYYLPTAPDMEVLDVVSKLFKGVEDIIRNSDISKRLFAFRVLVDVIKSLLRVREMALGGISSSLASQLILFITDRISLLVEALEVHQSDTSLELEFKSLLNLLFNMVKENSDLAGPILDKICLIIPNLLKVLERKDSKLKAELLNPEPMEFGRGAEISLSSEMMLCLLRVVAACIEEHPDEVTTKVLNEIKLLVKNVCQSRSFDVYTCNIYLLLLFSFIRDSCMWNAIDKLKKINGSSRLSCDDPLSRDGYIHDLAVDYAKKILGRKDNWYSYKIGKFAASRGAWSAAAVIFEQLRTMVQPDYFNCWLRTLAQISHSERQMELVGLLHSKDDLSDKEEDIAFKFNPQNFIETLLEASNTYLFSEQKLGSFSSGVSFSFQRWLLSLRARVLGTVVDAIKLLHGFSCAPDNASMNGQVESIITASSLVYPFIQVSNQFKNLALEFDLLATSFISMDINSIMTILMLALSCSLLAFSTGFAISIPNPHTLDNLESCDSEEQSYAMLIQDLVGRLWHLDCETIKILRKLSKGFQLPKSFSSPYFRKQIAGTCYEARGIVNLTRYAVTGILCLQKKAGKIQNDEDTFSIYKEVSQFLLKIFSTWMRIPFRIPNHFFRVRPCLSCELHVMNEEGIGIDGISVVSGSSLPLNLCLQLRNMPPDLPFQLIKFHCLLRCSTLLPEPASIGEHKWQKELDIHDWGAEDMIDLNLRLWHYITGSTNIISPNKNDGGGGHVVDEFLCLQPNKRGQGFASCLLDISTFPAGVYRIKWLSCCIDSTGSYWNLLPLNGGPVFSVQQSSNSS